MEITKVLPTLEEVNEVLQRRLSWTQLSAEEARQPLTISPHQVLQLVQSLGWHPTPTLAQCLDPDGTFCCPNCGHHRIEHVAEGPCDLRDMTGFTEEGLVSIVISHRSCSSEGDWWLQCRNCVFEFNLPDELEVEWR